MYKTIRHGENSLQYTILPQNDDFRMEGKLTSAESSCSVGRKSKGKRPRKRSFFTYLGLLFVCTVIVGALLIPFLVSADFLLNPSDWFLNKNPEKHNIPISALKIHGNTVYNNAHNNFISIGNIGKTVKIINQSGIEKVLLRINKTNSNATENLKLKSNLNGDLQNGMIEIQIDQKKVSSDGDTKSLINVQSNNAQNENENGNGKSILNNGNEMRNEILEDQTQNAQTNAQFNDEMKSKQSHDQAVIESNESNQKSINISPENPPNEHFVTEVRFEPVEKISKKPVIVPTIVVTTLRNQLNNNDPNSQQFEQEQHFQQEVQQQSIVQSQSQTAPIVRPITNLSNSTMAMNNVSNSRIIQVPLLKAAAKKPIIPPVLAKTNSQIGTANDAVTFGDEKLVMAILSPVDQQGKANVPSVVVKTKPVEVLKKRTRPKEWTFSHWPFIDSATYFPWNGYKSKDNVLLPALLGFSLVGVVLFIAVCIVARNKRMSDGTVRKRSQSMSDIEQNCQDDNETLLTAASLSDED